MRTLGGGPGPPRPRAAHRRRPARGPHGPGRAPPRGRRRPAEPTGRPAFAPPSPPGLVKRALDYLRGRSPPPAAGAAPADPAPGTFRARALERLAAELGQYDEIPVRGGSLYRWTLVRAGGAAVYITLDAPEQPEVAHIVMSSPEGRIPGLLEGRIATSEQQLGPMLEAIRWVLNSPGERPDSASGR